MRIFIGHRAKCGLTAFLCALCLTAGCRERKPVLSGNPDLPADMTDEERARLAEVEAENARLRDDVAKARKEKTDIDGKLNELTGRLRQSDEDLTTARTEVSDLLEKQKGLQADVEQKEQDLHDNELEILDLKGQLADVHVEMEKLASRLKSLQKEVTSNLKLYGAVLLVDLKHTSASLADLAKQIEEAIGANALGEDQRATLRAQLAKIQDSKVMMENALATLQPQVDSGSTGLRAAADTAYEALLKGRGHLEGAAQALRAALVGQGNSEALLAQIEALRTQLSTASAQLQEQMALVDEKNVKIETLNQEIAGLKEESRQKDQTIADLKTAHQKEIADLGARVSELQKSLADKDKQLATVQEELERERQNNGGERIATLEAEVKSLQAQRDQLIGRISTHTEDVKYLQARVLELTRKLESQQKDFTAPPLKEVRYTVFREWCEDRSHALDDVSRQTVKAILRQVGTEDCSLAQTRVMRTYNLTLNHEGISDLRPLAAIPTLRYLSLSGNRISDVSALAPLKLKELVLSDNIIQDLKGFDALRYPDELRMLVLSDNGIEKIDALARFSKLRELWLTGNQVKDLSPLPKEIEQLYIGRNQVADLTPLKALSGLKILGASQNPITAIAPVRNLPKLRLVWAKGTSLAPEERTCSNKLECHF